MRERDRWAARACRCWPCVGAGAARAKAGRRSRSSRRSPSRSRPRSPSVAAPASAQERGQARPASTPAPPATATPTRSTPAARSSRPRSRARLRRRLGGLRQQRRRREQLRPPEQEPARLHRREPRAVRRDPACFNASAIWNGGGRPGPLWDQAQKDAIIRFVQAGGGIAANHNATDMGAGVGHLGLVGRRQRLRRRHADEGPRGDEPEQRRAGPGRRPQPPLDARPARPVRLRRRALQLRAQRPRHPPRARDARRAHLHARATRWARTTRSPGASSTTATASPTARARRRSTTTAASG